MNTGMFSVRTGRQEDLRSVQVPNWVTMMPDLSDSAYRMYVVLLAQSGQPGTFSVDDFAGKTGRSSDEMAGIMDELETMNLLSTDTDRDGSRIFIIHEIPPADIAAPDSPAAPRARRADRKAGPGGERRRVPVPDRDDGGQEEHDLKKLVDELCGRLADLVKANGAKRPKITYAWRNAARDLLSGEDPYTFEQVWEGMQWAQEDAFWASRTITMTRLWKHFDQIIVQARKRTQDTSTPQGRQTQQDVVRQRMNKLSEFMENFEKRYDRQMSDAEQKQIMARLKEEIR